MATLVIKNFPDTLHHELKKRAQRHRRSLAKEALVLLEHGITEGDSAERVARIPEPYRLKGPPLTIDDIEAAIAEGRD